MNAATATTARVAPAGLTGYDLVAGARADFMPNGPEREAMRSAACQAHSLAQAIERGEDFTPEQFAAAARQIDDTMAQAGARRLAPGADKWIALFTA
ncbi:hypothetical protein ABTX60_06990 [Streptomyces sp. NPDC126510]|uniref:hypothetical protein n=1 Tax=Streptomyces sp. NPDC126510 TaxID=3155317 RepID=UPI003324383A